MLARCISGWHIQLSFFQLFRLPMLASRMVRAQELAGCCWFPLSKGQCKTLVKVVARTLTAFKAANWYLRGHGLMTTELDCRNPVHNMTPSRKSCLVGRRRNYAWDLCQLRCCIEDKQVNKFRNAAVRSGHQGNWRNRHCVCSGAKLLE